MKTRQLCIVTILFLVAFRLPSERRVGAEAARQVEQSTRPTVPNLGTTMRVSVDSVGSQEISTSLFPSISIDGRSADKANSFKWFLETSGTTEDLYGVHFVNKKIGWIVGNGGTILFTYNGGVNWSPQTSGVSVDLRGVYFSDSLTGWIVGSSGTILHTIDGGETWISQDSSTFDNLYALDFVDNKHGWVVGDNSTILYTNDGGVTWNPQKPPEGFTFFYSESVDFWDQTSGWLAPWGGNPGGGILSTTNGGLTWVQQPTNEIYYMTGVSFINAVRGWAAGYDVLRDPSCSTPWQLSTKVFQTVDGGINWTKVGTICGWSRAIDFVNATLGWLIVGDDTDAPPSPHHIFTTSNGGLDWIEQYFTETRLHNLFMVDANNGWAVGNKGTLLQYKYQSTVYVPITIR